jgi:hypothetical protein
VAWCGVVWCGVVWCGVVWCGVVYVKCCVMFPGVGAVVDVLPSPFLRMAYLPPPSSRSSRRGCGVLAGRDAGAESVRSAGAAAGAARIHLGKESRKGGGPSSLLRWALCVCAGASRVSWRFVCPCGPDCASPRLRRRAVLAGVPRRPAVQLEARKEQLKRARLAESGGVLGPLDTGAAPAPALARLFCSFPHRRHVRGNAVLAVSPCTPACVCARWSLQLRAAPRRWRETATTTGA